MATLIIEETKDPPPNNTVNIANMQLFESQIVGNIKKKAQEKKIKAKNRAEELRNKIIEEILYKFNKEYSLTKESRIENDSSYFKGVRKPIKLNIDTIKRMEMKPYSWTLSKIKKLIIEIAGSSNWTFLRHLIGEDLVNNPKYIRCPYRLCSDDNTFLTFKKAQSIHLYQGHQEKYNKPYIGKEFKGFDLEDKIELHDLVNSWFVYFMRHGSRFQDPKRKPGFLKNYGNTIYMRKSDCHYCIKAWADDMVEAKYFTHYNYDTLLNCLRDELIEGFLFVEDIGHEYITCVTFKRKEDDITTWVKDIDANNVAQGYENFEIGKIYNYSNFNTHQRKATAMALKYKAFIITGPPGSGKTFWIQNFVKAIETQTKKNVLLTAFFGKAVDNIESSAYTDFRKQRVKFGTAHKKILFSKYSKGCCSTCKDYLKKWRRGDLSFKKLQYKTISCSDPSCTTPFLKDLEKNVERVIRQFEDETPDIVIIDECSMLSLDLFHSILSVLMTKFHWKTQFIFIGDPDQIQPIGVGAVFEWMIQKTKIPVCKFMGSERIGDGDDDEEKKRAKQHLLNAFEAIRNEEENIPSRFKNETNFIVRVLPKTGEAGRKEFKVQRGYLETEMDDLIDTYQLNEENSKFLTVMNGDDLKHDMDNFPGAEYDSRWNGSRAHINEFLQKKFNPNGKKIIKTINNKKYDTELTVGSIVQNKINEYGKDDDDPDYYNGMEGKIIKQEGSIVKVEYDRDRMKNYEKDEDDDTYIPNKEYIDKEIGYEVTLSYALTAHKSQGSSIRNTVIIINKNHCMWAERDILLSNGEWVKTENTTDGKKIFYTCASRTKQRVMLIIMPKEKRYKWVDGEYKGNYSNDEMADKMVNDIVKSKKTILTKIFE